MNEKERIVRNMFLDGMEDFGIRRIDERNKKVTIVLRLFNNV